MCEMKGMQNSKCFLGDFILRACVFVPCVLKVKAC